MIYIICNSQLIITQLPAGKLDVFIRLLAATLVLSACPAEIIYIGVTVAKAKE